MKLIRPRVSVIIPSYQSAGSLPRAIQSVLNQDFSEFELLIVNNGSNDGTDQIIAEAEQADPRVKGVNLMVNQRPAGGRNRGVEEAKGDLIAFLDADDEWLSDKLRTQIALLDQFPDVDLVFTDTWNVDVVNDKKNTQSDVNLLTFQQLDLTPVPEFPNVFFVDGAITELIYKKSFINMSSTAMRKKSFLQIGGFNKARFGTEDIDFWVRLSQASKFIYWHIPTARCYQGTGTSAPNISWLRELISYHRMCLISPDYVNLRETALQNLQKIYRYLIVAYAMKAMPVKAWQTFRESSDLGFNRRLAIYALFSFAGPVPFWLGRWYTALRKKPNIFVKDTIFN